MKRRWPFVFLLICWLIILLVPPLRQMLWIQLSGRSEIYRDWTQGPFIDSWATWSPSTEQLVEQYPNDAQIGAVHIDGQGLPAGLRILWDVFSAKENRNDIFRGYDDLIGRFPQENWLVARRLVRTMALFRHNRLAGELDDPYSTQRKVVGGPPAPEKSKEKPNFTQKQWQDAVNLAKRGQQREPQNGFYDWVLVYLYFSNFLDVQGQQALDIASHKPHFDEHEREWSEAQIALREKALGRPLLWEEKLNLTVGSDRMSRNSLYRNMGSIIKWQGIKAERCGDKQKALRIYTDFARLMYRATLEARLWTDSMTTQAIADYVLAGDGRSVSMQKMPLSRRNSAVERAKVKSAAFSRFAKSQKRDDLAREMTALALAVGERQDKLEKAFKSPTLYNGMPVRPLMWTIIFWWSAMLMLLFFSLVLLLWLFLSALLRSLGVSLQTVTYAVSFKRAMPGLTLGTLAFVFAFALGAGWRSGWAIGYIENLPEYYGMIANSALAVGVILPLMWADGLRDFLTRRSKRALLQAANGQGWKIWKADLLNHIKTVRLMPAALGLFFQIVAGVAGLWWVFNFSGTMRGVIDHLNNQQAYPAAVQFLFEAHPLIPLIIFCSSLFISWIHQLWTASSMEKPIVRHGLRDLQGILGAYLIIFSLIYLVLLLVSLPLRAAADAQMNQLVKRGEVALMIENYRAPKSIPKNISK